MISMMSDYLEPTYAEISLSRKDLQKKNIQDIFKGSEAYTISCYDYQGLLMKYVFFEII